MKIAIVIPTYDRIDLLDRLLKSISEAVWPKSECEVWVIENGKKAGSEQVVAQYINKMPVYFLYEDRAGPSFARNRGVAASNADFFIFFDDDIRIAKQTIEAYEQAFIAYGETCFFGGPLLIDYEKKPADWLLSYLPYSAQGFGLGEKEQTIAEPSFLGANHAVSKTLLHECGDFDDLCPVGQEGMLGEETRLQQRLLDSGAKAVYLPGAKVWHFVPQVRCSEHWIIERQYRHGLTDASQLNSEDLSGLHFFGVPLWLIRFTALELVAYIISIVTFSSRQERFAKKNLFYRAKGMAAFFRGKFND